MKQKNSKASKSLKSQKRSRQSNARRATRTNAFAFEKLEARNLLTGAVVFNEVLYNPVQGQDFEFVELYNTFAVDVDISRWTINNGIDFTIPQGTVIGGGEFLVIAADPLALATTGVAADFGPYSGQASNSGETLELRDVNQRLIDQVNYSDSGEWPVAADGSGASLSKIAINLASDDPASWAASSTVGGTPGAENTFVADLPAINEVQAIPGNYQIEIYNGAAQPIDLSNYVLTQSGDFDHQATITGGTVPAQGYFTVNAQALGFTPAVGDKLFLATPGEVNVADGVQVTAPLIGRTTAGDGPFQIPNQATLGSSNTFSFRDEIVINEIQYHHAPQYGEVEQPSAADQFTPISFDSIWRFNESGSSLPTNWAQTTHPIGGDWSLGSGLIAFENDPLPLQINTTLDNPANNSVVTYYFETEFNITSDQLNNLATIELSHLVDDGAVFYINGVEFDRYKISGNIGDPVQPSTFANNGGEAQLVSGVDIPISLLVAGVNRLSIEVHQATLNSSDVVMGAQVTATLQSISTSVAYEENDLEWIELFNRSNQAVNIAGWELDDAIRFDFPNTTIPAGGYLVVTNDRTAFLAEYPNVDPGIVLGDFDGKLSNQSERILLLDAIGNTADEVTYFDGGRWAGAADGGGSTLELLDSDSDNAVAEAWGASDESAKSPWVTYTYTGIAGVANANNYPDPNNSTGGSDNDTTTFYEFIFGLLDSGEVLLDDLSVIENPNGAATEKLQDGTFESNFSTSNDPRLSVDTYRVLGTHGSHGLTGIVVDPDDPSNRVMRLVATDGADHQYNHVETTFANGAPIVDGREYQISFRAKWISGSPLFNTRLYFNKVAKTTTLTTPDAAGTPGAANSVAVVNAGPTFTNFEQTIAVPNVGQSVPVIAEANDNDGVAFMTLVWSVDEGSPQTALMTLNSDGQYVASIPGQALNSVVQFYVLATDSLGATSTYPAEGADSRALYKVLDTGGNTGGGSEVVIDDFNGSLSNWTSTVILDDNGGGSNTTNFVTSGGELQVNTTSYDGIEQHALIYNGLTLGVGDEIRLDLSNFSGDRNLGLYVGGTAPTTGIRRDYIAVYGASSGSIASRGFDGTNEYNNPSTFPADYSQVFIARTANNTFEVGYYTNAGNREILTIRTPSFANAATFVGIYADVRSTGTISAGADNLTLVTAGGSGSGNGLVTPTGAPSFRIIMTEADRTFLHENTNVMSNDGIRATVVYNNTDVYHNVYVRLKSSMRGRWDDTRLGFKVKFDPTNLFNGLHQTVDLDRSGAGRGSPFDYFGQGELISWHILNQAGGVAGFQNDLVYLEQPRAGTGEGTLTSAPAQLVFTAYRNNYLDSAYEDGSDGKLFKFASIYATDTEHTVNGDPEGFKTHGRRFNQVFTTPLQDLGDDPEAYRYNYLLQNNEAQNDLSPVIELAKTFSLSQNQFNAVIDDVIDVDHFLRTAAAMSLLGAGDNFFSGTNNNLQLYQRPSDGKFEFFPWDNDSQRGVNATASLVGNSDIQKVINVSSTNLRNYYSHLNDIMDSTFNTAYMSYWANHYEGLVSSSQDVNQDFGEILSFIGNRNSYVTNQLNNIVNPNTGFEITTNGGSDIFTGQNTVTIQGTGNLDVNQIRLVGSDQALDVTWISNTQWQVTLTEVFGANTFAFEATRFNGDVVGSDLITVTAPTNSQAQQDFLRITEFHYNPPGSGDPTEFIELTNIGATALDVSGAIISEGPSTEFVVPNGTSLAAGESLVIASDLVAFEAAYPQVNTALLLGPYTGGLSNSGETLTLLDSSAAEIMSVTYQDGDLWSPLADGEGASLELVDAFNTPVETLDKYFSWRASNEVGGTPGSIGTGPSGVVINEVLAHTDLPQSDTIELFNSSATPVDISGWWLSDSTDSPLKYQIPAGTTLAAGAYITFDESDFNPTPLTPGVNDFALSSAGDQIVLSQGTGGVTTHFEDMVDFGATSNGDSLGRLPNGTGRLTRLASNSLGSANGAQAVSDLVISEVNYHPGPPNAAALAIDPLLTDDDLEFVEIANHASSSVDLTDWRIRGEIDYDFAPASIAAGETLVVLRFDPSDTLNATKLSAFLAHYGLSSATSLVGGFTGGLSNGTGRVSLQQPDAPDLLGEIPHVVVDEVVYDDLAPWADADGTGQSLQRDDVGANGNLSNSWVADAPTPGFFEDQFLLGDTNQDGFVNFLDISPFITLLQTGTYLAEGDVNEDGVINFLDISPFINELNS